MKEENGDCLLICIYLICNQTFLCRFLDQSLASHFDNLWPMYNLFFRNLLLIFNLPYLRHLLVSDRSINFMKIHSNYFWFLKYDDKKSFQLIDLQVPENRIQLKIQFNRRWATMRTSEWRWTNPWDIRRFLKFRIIEQYEFYFNYNP